LPGRVLRFPSRPTLSDEHRAAARCLFETPFSERQEKASVLGMDNPETILSFCALLGEQLYTSPSRARDEAEFLYRHLQKPERKIGLFDERDYFLGELALIAGTACRQISRREEGRVWFDRAELAFRNTANAAADLSRLAYQRLALRLEERQLDVILELAPSVAKGLEELGMPEESLKCRFLEGIALAESGRLEDAVALFESVGKAAEDLRSDRLLSLAYGNLTHYNGMLGHAEEAILWSRRAIPLLKRLDDRVGLAKIRWGLANLLRETGRIPAAIQAYRAAQREFADLEMRADVAALHLVLADLLLEGSEEREAMREIVAALPVIDELQMVPEGTAALSLLRESVRQQRINRQALRDLHGYFDEVKRGSSK
jgi:tetratricopeptide (TPR) repeat protein